MSTAWYEEFFDDTYYAYASRRDAESRIDTQQEVHFALQALGLCDAKPKRILDLCCGYGRHAVELALVGHEVVGADLSQCLLERAAELAAANNVQVDLQKVDVRAIRFSQEFDAVVCFNSCLGGLESDDEYHSMLHGIFLALKPLGVFLLDLDNMAYSLRGFQAKTWHLEADGLLTATSRKFDPLSNRVEGECLRIKDSRCRSHRVSIRLFTYPEIASRLKLAGFEPTGAFGDYSGSTFEMDSKRMIITAKRYGADHAGKDFQKPAR